MDKLKARAERFGLPIAASNNPKTIGTKPPKSENKIAHIPKGILSVSVDEDLVAKRKAKFGGVEGRSGLFFINFNFMNSDVEASLMKKVVEGKVAASSSSINSSKVSKKQQKKNSGTDSYS